MHWLLARQMETSYARRRFTEDQIIGVLRKHKAAVKMVGLCRKHGIGDATFANDWVTIGGRSSCVSLFQFTNRSRMSLCPN
jgi:hypothetical protein